MTTTFTYTGRTRAGDPVSGERVATSVDAAVAALRREQILVTRIETVDKPAALLGWLKGTPKAGSKVASKSLAVFTRQFSVMIDAGLPLVDCLEILGRQDEDPGFGRTILEVRSAVEAGAGLANAMARYPRTFDPLYTSMVAAGEAGGVLDAILKRLASYIEKSVKLRAQVKSALTYPTAVIAIAVIVVAAILWKVIPTFSSLFDGLGATLPLPTLIVIAISDSFVAALPIIVLAIVGGGVAVRQFNRTERGRRAIDGLLLRVPGLGSVLRKVAVARFCRTLATLLASGVPILEGLAITAETAGNRVIQDAVLSAREAIEGGESIAAPLEATAVFPLMVTQMINIGETTGALDTMLEKIADFYEDEVDTAVTGMLSLLEPVMIAFLGVVVGSIVIAMYLPIFDLISRMSM